MLFFMKITSSTGLIGKASFINPFFFWFPVLLCLSNPFFLSLLFFNLELCFCSTSKFDLKKTTYKTPFLVKLGVATKDV